MLRGTSSPECCNAKHHIKLDVCPAGMQRRTLNWKSCLSALTSNEPPCRCIPCSWLSHSLRQYTSADRQHATPGQSYKLHTAINSHSDCSFCLSLQLLYPSLCLSPRLLCTDLPGEAGSQKDCYLQVPQQRPLLLLWEQAQQGSLCLACWASWASLTLCWTRLQPCPTIHR